MFPFFRQGIEFVKDKSFFPRALNNLGRTEDAISAYRLYLEKEPSDPDGHRDLAELYLDAGSYKMAERELKLSLRFRKNDKITNDLMVELKLATGGAFEFTKALLEFYKIGATVH